jgi:hypothetical protein
MQMAMAKKQAPQKKARASAPVPHHSVSVPIPHNTSIRVTDLKSLSEKDLNELLEKAKTSQVGYVILNAPFKLPTVKPVS